MSARSAAKLRVAAQVFGISQREYQRQRAAGVLPGVRELESMGVFDDAELRAAGIEPLPPAAPRVSRARPRDLAGQNARANARARALGYPSKDAMYAARRAGRPTPDDIRAGGANFARLPNGNVWVRVDYSSPRAKAKADALVARALAAMPTPNVDVRVTVGFGTGLYRQLGQVPATELENGLTLFLADQLISYVPQIGGGGGGVGMERPKNSPEVVAWLQARAQDPMEADTSLFDDVNEVQLTFVPASGGGASDDF